MSEAAFFQVKKGSKTWHAEAIMRRCELVCGVPVKDDLGNELTVQIGLCMVQRFGQFDDLYLSTVSRVPEGGTLCRYCKRHIRALAEAVGVAKGGSR